MTSVRKNGLPPVRLVSSAATSSETSTPERVSDVVAHRAGRQSLELEADRADSGKCAEQFGERDRRVEPERARGDDDQDRQIGDDGEEPSRQSQTVRIGPLDIVEGEHGRSVAQRTADCIGETVDLRRSVAHPALGDRCEHVGRAERSVGCRSPSGERWTRVRVPPAATDPGAALRGDGEHLVDEPRFPDAGFAGHDERRAPSPAIARSSVRSAVASSSTRPTRASAPNVRDGFGTEVGCARTDERGNRRSPVVEEVGILPQYPQLQPLQLGAGIDAEFLGERGPRSTERVERVALAAGAVEGEREQIPEGFSEGVQADQLLERRHGLEVAPAAHP